jgi:hypothetical protein
VDELFGLILDGLNHGRVAVAGGAHRNAGGEVEIAVAIDIPDFGAAATIHDKRIVARVRG